MHLVVGLGNPGEKYLKSRHNAGFILLDFVIQNGWENDKYAEAMVASDAGNFFAKPETFMNHSGKSVKFLSDKHGISAENIIVIHDDIDLPFGATKIVFESGAGGHNGVASIIESLGTNKFIRIKIGIAPVDSEGKAIKPKPGIFGTPQKAVAKYVLKDFSKNDLTALATLAPRVREIVDTVTCEGRQSAMNKFN
jgi:PTH1 family peptidyl-tRNA hydrolase